MQENTKSDRIDRFCYMGDMIVFQYSLYTANDDLDIVWIYRWIDICHKNGFHIWSKNQPTSDDIV